MASRAKRSSLGAAPPPNPHLAVGGPGSFGPLYFAAFVYAVVLAHAVYRPDLEDPIWMAGAVLLLALSAVCGALGRPVFHDWLISLAVPGRIALVAVLIAILTAPAFVPNRSALPDGFLWVMAVLVPLCVNPPMTRVYAGIGLMCFWSAAGARDLLGPGVVIGFGLAFLWLLSAAHFSFTGAPFGLRGWWPVRRQWLAVALYGAPASLAAWMTYELWLTPGGSKPQPVDEEGRAVPRGSVNLTPDQINRLLIDLAIMFAMIVAALIALYLLRRFMSGRAKPVDLPHLPGAELSELQMVAAAGAGPVRSLRGNRGRILALWQKWSKRVALTGLGRGPGETAAELAERVAAESEDGGAPPEMTQLVEKAHYSPTEPTREDVRAMQRLVRDEIERRK